MNTGEKIKLLREKHNYTLEELGKKVGVGKSTVRKWETGMIANMGRDKIAKLAEVFDVSPTYLISDDSKNSVTTKDDGQEEKYEEIRQIFDELNLENAESLREYALFLLQRQKSQDVQ